MAVADLERAPGGRPEHVSSLLTDGEVYDNWFTANKRQNRFFVLNFERVFGRLGLDHTTTGTYFERARKVIENETDWPAQYPFKFHSSHTQIYPDRRFAPKLFERAATLIVAMEVAASEKRPEIDVYKDLKILPAQYFVDRFDKLKLAGLTSNFESTLKKPREGVSESTELRKLMLASMEQEFSLNLIEEMLDGYCVTRHVGQSLVKFVNSRFPTELHIGPVRPSGDEAAIIAKLGYKAAAPSLKVPRSTPEST